MKKQLIYTTAICLFIAGLWLFVRLAITICLLVIICILLEDVIKGKTR